MNELKVFENSEFGKLNVLDVDGKTYFPATECAKLIGYANANDAISRHCRWVVKHDLPHPQSPEKTIGMNFIPEGDLYRLISHSTLPAAERFERWVFDEVLPAIRKHGMYATPQTVETMLADPDTMIRTLTALKEERELRRALAEENETLEIALNESLQYYTVAKYNKTFKKGWSLAQCQHIGRQMAAYCRAHAIKMRRCETENERFGRVNSYPLPAWEAFFDKEMLDYA